MMILMINQPASTAFHMKNDFWTKISKNGHSAPLIGIGLMYLPKFGWDESIRSPYVSPGNCITVTLPPFTGSGGPVTMSKRSFIFVTGKLNTSSLLCYKMLATVTSRFRG